MSSMPKASNPLTSENQASYRIFELTQLRAVEMRELPGGFLNRS